MLASLLGGLGVFLLGMVLLTDGLKALAGEALRRILTRYVATPRSGLAWGALVTTLVQSSTATTLATVGFVSAGLLTFTQAIGVIFGANLGTTSTGWIVSQLGFKVSLGAVSPPLILAGVAMRLLFKGRWSHAGTALAGFALLFMGIDLLQGGMGDLAARLSPGDIPGSHGSSWGPRLALVGVGFLMTLVMQSSSASMAATLAAVASGAIGIEQAAALAIGQNIGTTPTAVAAAIGAPTAAKRTAAAHVLFNTITAVVALVLLHPLVRVCLWAAGLVGADDAPTVLALFHTAFNALGVLLLMPVLGPFARLIERVFPERGLRSTRYLAPSVAQIGPVAVEAARRALISILADVGALVFALVRPHGRPPSAAALDEAVAGLQAVARFIHRLGQAAQGAGEQARAQALLHATEHLDRAVETLRSRPAGLPGHPARPADPVIASACTPLADLAGRVASLAEPTEAAAAPDLPVALTEDAHRISVETAGLRRQHRRDALGQAASGLLDPDLAMRRIDTILWLDGIAYHLWRAAHHLRADPDKPAAEAAAAVEQGPIEPLQPNPAPQPPSHPPAPLEPAP